MRFLLGTPAHSVSLRWARLCAGAVLLTGLAAPGGALAQQVPAPGAASPLPLPLPQPAPAVTVPPVSIAPGEPDKDTGPWAVNFEDAQLLAAPADDADVLAKLHQYTYLHIQDYDGDFARVLDPRTRTVGFVRSDRLGPTDPPPAYITADPPDAYETLNLPGRVVRGAHFSFYPTPEDEAQTARAGHNESVLVADAVEGTDGEPWYRTADGDYLPGNAVRLPRTPPRTFPGRWIDADLAEPAMLTAYEGDRIVLATLTIKGAGAYQTPTGVFAIQRRVADETMSSETIGIPRFGPGGYHLEHVLWTQYFTGDGASIHYNYWSSNFGYAGSHGCLGLNYADSAFLWSWAGVGTPVSIHY